MLKECEREIGRRRFLWLADKDKSGLTLQELADRYGTSAGGIWDFKERYSRPVTPSRPTVSISRYIGYLFRERCQELGKDPAVIDASLADP